LLLSVQRSRTCRSQEPSAAYRSHVGAHARALAAPHKGRRNRRRATPDFRLAVRVLCCLGWMGVAGFPFGPHPRPPPAPNDTDRTRRCTGGCGVLFKARASAALPLLAKSCAMNVAGGDLSARFAFARVASCSSLCLPLRRSIATFLRATKGGERSEDNARRGAAPRLTPRLS
jgi:hypothetical protein